MAGKVTPPTPEEADALKDFGFESDTALFEDTDDIPPGRKSRVVSDQLWFVLEDSALRSKGKVRIASPEEIDELRKDLGSAAVRAKYNVVTSSATMENGNVKFTFHATHK